MSGPKPMNCALPKCASEFLYHQECGLVASGCCAREMLSAAARNPDGVHFPMDLRPGGNPFVNAMEAAGLVRVRGEITQVIA